MRTNLKLTPVDAWTRSVDDVQASINKAAQILMPVRHAAPDYPVEALGPLAEICVDTAREGQLRPAMAGQCLLATAALLTQGLHNVQTLAGPKPLSLYLTTLGDSGDGKSTCEATALGPVNAWQRHAQKKYDEREATQQRKACKNGEDEPPAQKRPYRLVADATTEALRSDFEHGLCTQGMFTAEGAAVLAGYGMSATQRAKTAATFNRLWDDGHLSVSRVTAGRFERFGQRLSIHWLLQPSAAAEVISDPALSAIGFWPRFCLAWPEPGAPRVARPFAPQTLGSVTRYTARCDELLQMPLPDDVTDAPVIGLSSEAQIQIGKALERFEIEGRRGKLRLIKPFALRAAEQVCRVAGVLAAFAGRDCVDEGDAVNALRLVSYGIETWLAVFEQGVQNDENVQALHLYKWLATREKGGADRRDILRLARPRPASSRARDALVEILLAHGLAVTDRSMVFALDPR